MGMLEGALILLAGFLLGRFLPSRRRLSTAGREDPKPVCGCTHHHSFHDPETGECHQTVDGKPVHFDKWGEADSWEQVRCACRRYSGPEPLPVVFAPEIGGTGA